MDDFALLRLQIEWGADEALDTDPVDRLRAVARPPVARPDPVVRRPEVVAVAMEP